ncbi:MAG TPA: hypothetical protein VHZ95_17915, partial [Polyangiales bacterium]|nr:hypothetical protein [Polyangiales bacterium]
MGRVLSLTVALLLGCSDTRGDDRERRTRAVQPETQGVTYFVRLTGDDRAAGTSVDQSWQSVARVDRQSFAPGDRVLFEAGQEYRGTLTFDADDRGTVDAPIEIGSFGTG